MASKTVAVIRPQSTALLDSAAKAAAAISILSELRGRLEDAKHNQGGEHFEWFSEFYGGAIAAGIESLAKSIEGNVEDVTAEVSRAVAR